MTEIAANHRGFILWFTGLSGAGKSTLAAYFAGAGREVLCDDVCVISFDESGAPFAWPGLPRLKLWGDASAMLGYDPQSLERAVEGMEKYHVPLAAPPRAQPVPFRRLYLLRRAPADEPGEIVRLRGRDALETVMSHTYRGEYLQQMDLGRRHFLQSASLANRIEVYAASRRWGYDKFAEEADSLARHFASPMKCPAGTSV